MRNVVNAHNNVRGDNVKRIKRMFAALTLAVIALTFSGCMSEWLSSDRGETWVAKEDLPKLPEKLETDRATGIPSLKVYDTSEDRVQTMDIENYVMGVVAGEMKNDWPMEALKAQAILARTFVLKFCEDKKSKYKGADISTDVTEAQAYDATSINDRVRQAVRETEGLVMSHQGEYPYAWFHAHAGGKTELPSVALDYKDGDPAYLKPVESQESEKAPESARKWTATFDADEVVRACADAGLKIESLSSIEAGERGESGRLKTIIINGESVSAPSFRIQIGANKLRSTLIDSISLENGIVIFEGRGFGHGVGMSQWGAYAMAERGDDAETIIRHYFIDVDIVGLW